MKLFLNDTKQAPDGWRLVTTASEMILLLGACWGEIECISLDHDLGTEDDGMDVLNWIESLLHTTTTTLPFRIHINSENSVERSRMETLAANLMSLFGNTRVLERSRRYPRFEDESWVVT